MKSLQIPEEISCGRIDVLKELLNRLLNKISITLFSQKFWMRFNKGFWFLISTRISILRNCNFCKLHSHHTVLILSFNFDIFCVATTISGYFRKIPGLFCFKFKEQNLRFWNQNKLCVLEKLIHLKEIKGNAQLVQKVTFELLMDFKQNHYENWKYYKSCYF